tara:strand:- start:382 stop:543 length:162 start_codon:yes stop_codon:yes gene_type:complete
MNEAKKKVILDLNKRMIIEPSETFEDQEFKESVKLYLDIIKTLIEEDDQKDNI